jgi:hypothetical protein
MKDLVCETTTKLTLWLVDPSFDELLKVSVYAIHYAILPLETLLKTRHLLCGQSETECVLRITVHMLLNFFPEITQKIKPFD